MTTTSQTWTEQTVEAAGTSLQIVRGGAGDPLLILHDELGHSAWQRYHEDLAQGNALHLPSHPGFGASPRLEWVMTVRDLAGWYLRALDELGLGSVNVIGFSMGAWLAAEMAAICPHQFKKMVLVGPMGIKPPEGEIFDMFVVTAQPYLAEGFIGREESAVYQSLFGGEITPEQREFWEVAREQACRLAWRPYMYDQALPHLLPRAKSVPTLIVHGEEDAIVPISAAQLYNESIPGSRLVTVASAGHRPELEQPEQFVKLVNDFLK